MGKQKRSGGGKQDEDSKSGFHGGSEAKIVLRKSLYQVSSVAVAGFGNGIQVRGGGGFDLLCPNTLYFYGLPAVTGPIRGARSRAF